MIDFDLGGDREDPPSPDMTPMIDIIFQLLIFFTLTSFALHPALEVVLPKSSTAVNRPPSIISVTVPVRGPILLEGKAVAEGELVRSLVEARNALMPGDKPDLSVFADQETAYRRLVEVMDAAEAADLGTLRFVVENNLRPSP